LTQSKVIENSLKENTNIRDQVVKRTVEKRKQTLPKAVLVVFSSIMRYRVREATCTNDKTGAAYAHLDMIQDCRS